MGLGRARLQNLRLLFSRATGFVQRVQVSARVSQGSSGIGRGQFVCPPAECVTGRIAILDALKFPMTPLTIFGLFAVTAMLVCYALEARSRWFILAFAGACALGSVYGFLQGAWPFGLVEAVWSVVAIRRWALAGRVK